MTIEKVINYEISIKIFRRIFRNFIRIKNVSKNEEEIEKAIRKILLDYCEYFKRYNYETVAITVKFEGFLSGGVYFEIPHCGYSAIIGKTWLPEVITFDKEEIELFRKIILNIPEPLDS